MAYKRSGKFYRNNEAELMRELGLKPTVNSGSGWIEKEDGQSEHVICQLKSTDAGSIKVNKQDLDKLKYNAIVSHKIPIFAIQFLQSNEHYIILKPSDLRKLLELIQSDLSGENAPKVKLHAEQTKTAYIANESVTEHVKRKTIKSNAKARKEFNNEKEKQYVGKKDRRVHF